MPSGPLEPICIRRELRCFSVSLFHSFDVLFIIEVLWGTDAALIISSLSLYLLVLIGFWGIQGPRLNVQSLSRCLVR